MKRVQLIEIAVLTVAIISGYKFISYLYELIMSSMIQVMDGGELNLKFLIRYFFITVIYLGVFILLVRKSKWIANYIDKKGQLHPELLNTGPEMVNLSIKSESLLHIVVITLCLSTILLQIPTLLIYLYDRFKHEVSPGNTDNLVGRSAQPDIPLLLCRIFLSVIILYLARPLARWLSASPELPVIETTDSNAS